MILLEKKRLEERMSKRELGRRAGVDASLITLAKQRGLRLYPGQLNKIAQAFGIPEEKAESLLEEAKE